jgi:hypothetical protein
VIERRDNGDLILFASNGDPLVKFQAHGPFICVNTNLKVGETYESHPLNTRAEKLDDEAIRVLGEWCEVLS